MYAIVGLGNIGNGYKNTYHNVGFNAVDMLAKDLGIKFDTEKCKSMLGFGMLGDKEVVLVKPTTYMNLSGNAVNEVMRKYKVRLSEIIVISDDIDLPRGKFRFRESGSGGTHNGLRNIVEVLKTKDFARLRIGVDKDARMDLADYVLSKTDPYAREEIEKATREGIDFIKDMLLKK